MAKRIGKSRANISNLMRLLTLPQEVQDMVSKGKLSYGQARTLLALDSQDKIVDLAKRCVKEDLSVRELEKLTQKPSKKTIEQIEPKTPTRANDDVNHIGINEAKENKQKTSKNDSSPNQTNQQKNNMKKPPIQNRKNNKEIKNQPKSNREDKGKK